MRYKNISGETISFKQSSAEGVNTITAEADEIFVTSPVHASTLLEAGKIEQIVEKKGKRSPAKKKETKKEPTE